MELTRCVSSFLAWLTCHALIILIRSQHVVTDYEAMSVPRLWIPLATTMFWFEYPTLETPSTCTSSQNSSLARANSCCQPSNFSQDPACSPYCGDSTISGLYPAEYSNLLLRHRRTGGLLNLSFLSVPPVEFRRPFCQLRLRRTTMKTASTIHVLVVTTLFIASGDQGTGRLNSKVLPTHTVLGTE